MEKKENASKLISSLVALSLATTLGVPSIALAEATGNDGEATVMQQSTNEEAVAQEGAVKEVSTFTELKAAIDNAANGDTVKLLNDIELDQWLTIDADITLDLNGKTLSNAKNFWDVKDNSGKSMNSLIETSGNVVITGNGAIRAKQDDCYAIDLVEGSLTIESGEIIGNVSAVQVVKGFLKITGGHFSQIQQGSYGDKYLINCIDAAWKDGSAKIAIAGGTFTRFDPAQSSSENPAAVFAAAGYTAVKSGDDYTVAWDESNAASIDSSDGIKYGYKTLDGAISAAGEGDTVTVLADTEVSSTASIDKNLVLDFGGKTVSFDDAGLDVGCQKPNTTLTLKNGTMKVTRWGIWLQNSAYLDVASDMTITANSAKSPSAYGIVVTQGSTLDMSGTVKTQETGAISGNGSVGLGNTTINVYPGANVIGEEGAIGIYHPQSGTLNIKGGTIKGDMGVQLCAGEGVVTEIEGDATIVGTGTDQRADKGTGDGVIPDGAAVSIVNRNYPGGTPLVNIKAGTFTSANQSAILAYDWANGAAAEWSASSAPAMITGGTFSSEPDAGYVADGYEAVASGSNYVVQRVAGIDPAPNPAPTTETTTTTNPDGTTTTTVTDKKTGESTSTTEGANGTTVVEKTDASGNTTTKVTVPEGAATNAGAPVEIPAAVEVTKGKEVSISAPAGTIVAIPAAADAGNVAVIVHADGTETVIPMSLVEGGKAIVKLDGDETIKIVDNAKDFSDVPAEHWAADDIDFASSHEIFKGIDNGDTYEPETALTRNMMMTVLARTDGADTSDSDPWYAKGQQWAVDNGVSNGLWGEDSITREQLVTMLFNYANKSGMDTSARADVSGMENADAVSDWALEAVQWAVAEGILKGVDNTDLAPQGLATRAQAAAFMQRYVKAALL